MSSAAIPLSGIPLVYEKISNMETFLMNRESDTDTTTLDTWKADWRIFKTEAQEPIEDRSFPASSIKSPNFLFAFLSSSPSPERYLSLYNKVRDTLEKSPPTREAMQLAFQQGAAKTARKFMDSDSDSEYSSR